MNSATDSSSGISFISDVVEPARLDLASEENANYSTHHQASGTELELDSEVLPNDAGLNVIDMGRSDIELWVNNTVFRTHAHLLVKFARLEDFIDRTSSSDTRTQSIRLDRDEQGAEDMTNTFKILYASVITGPFKFESPILISALRIATAYDYPALRGFAIEHLEKANLGPVQRIELAREFSLTAWEEPAYNELYTRNEALTDQEAQILGVMAFAKVARMREREKLEVGREIGKREFRGALERGETPLIEENKRDKAQAEAMKLRQKKAKEEEEKKREKREITADEALRWYREALAREAKERQEKIKAEAEERERKRKETVERVEQEQQEKKAESDLKESMGEAKSDLEETEERESRERGERGEREEEGRAGARGEVMPVLWRKTRGGWRKHDF